MISSVQVRFATKSGAIRRHCSLSRGKNSQSRACMAISRAGEPLSAYPRRCRCACAVVNSGTHPKSSVTLREMKSMSGLHRMVMAVAAVAPAEAAAPVVVLAASVCCLSMRSEPAAEDQSSSESFSSVYVGVSLPATVTLTPPERASPMRLARS